MAKIGIDFGTTNSLMVSYNKDKNKFDYFTYDGERPVPTSSTVWYHDGGVKVGKEARDNMFAYADVEGNSFVRSIKSKFSTGEAVDINGEIKRPAAIATDIIKNLVDDAKSADAEKLHIDLNQAVFTIPINFSGKAREELRKAANDAGIEITTFIHEPFAAIVGYFFSKKQGESLQSIKKNLSQLEGKKLLTFDWGGGTLDITVVSVSNGRMVEIGTAELTNMAGDEIDELIANDVWYRFKNQLGNKYTEEYLELCKRKKWGKILSRAEMCKILLSSEDSADFTMFNVVDDEEIKMVITRDDLDRIMSDMLDAAFSKIEEAISEAHTSKREIKVILTGGTCNIPAVQRRMVEEFGSNVETVNNADLVIAQGAAVIAEMGWMPFLTKDIMIAMCDGSYWPLFEHDTRISTKDVAKAAETFTCVDQRQSFAKVIICEGFNNQEYFHQEKDKILQVLKVPVLDDNRFGDDIVVEAEIDKNIIMQVRAYSKMVCGYESNEEYSKGKKAEIYQLCFGLDFGD